MQNKKSDIEQCNCGQFYVTGDYLYCPNCNKESNSFLLTESFIIDQAVEEYYLNKLEQRKEE
tara:strand:- start:113 stop:298 length:186 start_codon:yes stop_codon:yes gene_type:complete